VRTRLRRARIDLRARMQQYWLDGNDK
jgi:hypothetical protein